MGLVLNLKEYKPSKAFPLLKIKVPYGPFLEKINFVRRFVPNFAEIVKPMNDLLKKYTPYSWNQTKNKAFEYIKERIAFPPS